MRKDQLFRSAGMSGASRTSRSEGRRHSQNIPPGNGRHAMVNGREPSKKRKKNRGQPKEGVTIDGDNLKQSKGTDGEAKPVVEDRMEPESLEELVRGRMQDILSRPGVAQVTINLVESGVEKKILLKRPPQSEIEGSVVERTDEDGGRRKVSKLPPS